VETVGDKYMAVSGLPEPCQQQALCIARLALDMMDLSMDVAVDGISVVLYIFTIPMLKTSLFIQLLDSRVSHTITGRVDIVKGLKIIITIIK